MLTKYLSIFFLSVSVIANAQVDVFIQYNSLEIEEDESITFHGDTLLIDTLRMYNNARLILTSDCFIHVRHAFLAESVRIESTGINGSNGLRGTRKRPVGLPGQDGSRGGNLTMFIQFEALGSLDIVTKGGDGGNGGNGSPASSFQPFAGVGENGLPGADGGDGGNGGDGGDVHLRYKARGFVPIIDGNKRLHSINIVTNGGGLGKAGRGGRGGLGGRAERMKSATGGSFLLPAGENGANGLNGSVGKEGNAGAIKFEKRG